MVSVQAASLLQYGAVSDVVVREMALGARRAAHADYAISVSGIAGPDGGSEEKPVGTVWLKTLAIHPPVQDSAQVTVALRCFSFSPICALSACNC